MRNRKLLAFFSILITVIICISVRQQCYASRIEQSCVNDANGNVLYTTTRNYNDQNKVTEVKTVDLKSKALVDYTYEYTNSSNMSKEKDNLAGSYREFDYDSTGQLVSERYYDSSGKLSEEITYQYDLKGNRTKKLVIHNNSTETTNYEYNNQSQITKVNNQEYKYDEHGNLIQDGIKTNTYDGKGQLIQVNQGNKVVESYQYDKDGVRVEKESNGVTEVYTYSEGQLSAITDSKGTRKFAFTRDTNGNLVSMTDQKDTYWYLFDGSWNVKGLADKEGTKVVSYEYDAYGNCIKLEGNIANPFMFMGYVYDTATGYYFLNARYYDPATGRFISADGYTGDALVTSNMYKYANNNPLRYKDSGGHWSESIDSKLPEWAQREILSLTVEWNKATTNEARDRIHAKANNVRAYAEKQNPTMLMGVSAVFTVKYGSNGDDVRSLQQSLKDSGYTIVVDGIFLSKTYNILCKYQSSGSLSIDGIAGMNTWVKMGEVYYGVIYINLNQVEYDEVDKIADANYNITDPLKNKTSDVMYALLRVNYGVGNDNSFCDNLYSILPSLVRPKLDAWAKSNQALANSDPDLYNTKYADEVLNFYDAVIMNQDIFEIMDSKNPFVIASAAILMGGTFKFKGSKRVNEQEAENERLARSRILEQNKIAGKAAEELVKNQLISQGFEIVGRQVTIKTSKGIRCVDHLVLDSNKNLIAIEVKSGNAVRSRSQREKDKLMETEVQRLNVNSKLEKIF